MVNTPPLRTQPEIADWLVGKVAHRLGIEPSSVGTDTYFDDFGLDSTEALVLAGELEAWIGIQLPTTALWYHPTIEQLSAFIEEELQGDASAA